MMQSKMAFGWSLLRSSKFYRCSLLLDGAALWKPRLLPFRSLYTMESRSRSKAGSGLRKWRRTLYSASFLAATFPTLFGTASKKHKPNPMLPASASVEISQIMLLDHTNTFGNVHGGVILRLIEQAGQIVASRHCNSTHDSKPVVAVLARVEHMDFHLPMYVAEVAQIKAAVTFTSKHSLEVTVDVWAENVTTGEHRNTNSARLWYVAIPAQVGNYERKFETVAVPPLVGLSEEETEQGKERYLAQKLEREAKQKEKGLLPTKGFGHYSHEWTEQEPELYTPEASRTTLANIVLPSDCTLTGHMMAGPLMKIMDNAAGICAVRHCRNPAVTASLDAINFDQPILNGEVYFVIAQMIFTSERSMNIEVRVEAEGLQSGSRRITNSAYFTFVSFNKLGKVTSVPPLKLQTEEQKAKFEERRIQYVQQKRKRSLK